MNHANKYLAIVEWARNRYSSNGRLVISTGGIPSVYSRIESAAFNKYMAAKRDESGSIVFGA